MPLLFSSNTIKLYLLYFNSVKIIAFLLQISILLLNLFFLFHFSSSSFSYFNTKYSKVICILTSLNFSFSPSIPLNTTASRLCYLPLTLFFVLRLLQHHTQQILVRIFFSLQLVTFIFLLFLEHKLFFGLEQMELLSFLST